MRRIQKVPYTIICDKTNNTVPTTPPVTLSLNGFLRGVKIKAPAAVETSATTTVTIADSDGDTIYSKSGIAAAAINVEYQDSNHVPTQLPLADKYTISAALSANQTVARTVIVTLFIESFI